MPIRRHLTSSWNNIDSICAKYEVRPGHSMRWIQTVVRRRDISGVYTIVSSPQFQVDVQSTRNSSMDPHQLTVTLRSARVNMDIPRDLVVELRVGTGNTSILVQPTNDSDASSPYFYRNSWFGYQDTITYSITVRDRAGDIIFTASGDRTNTGLGSGSGSGGTRGFGLEIIDI